MSQLTKQALKVENNTQFPNNNAGLITPSNLRTFNEDMIDSTVNQTTYTTDSASFDSRLNSVSPNVTGSSLITASFNNSTRNLTFTKGDLSQFNVNIPDASGSTTTGFATTGSNIFIGDQTITGSLIVSSSTTQNQIIGTNGGNGTGTRVTGRFEVNGPLHAQQDAYVGSLYIANTLNKNGAGDIIVGSNLRLEDPNNPAGSQNPINLIVSGSTNITGSLTASIQEGYVLVGGAGNISKTVSTSSLVTLPAGILSSSNTNFTDFSQSVDTRLDGLEAFSTSLDATFVNQSELAQATGSLIDLIATKLNTSSFQSYTSSNDSKVTSLINATGSYATTGSNTFTGTQTFNDTITANSTASLFNSVKLNNSLRTTTNPIQLDVASGSIVLSTPSATPSLTQLGFVSSSNLAGQVNLIFRNGIGVTDLTLSGSNNILGIPAAPTAGFKRYLSDNNLILTARTPEITGSSAFSPNISNNIFANSAATNILLRTPVSSSTYTLATNLTLGTINLGTSATNNYEKAVSGTSLQQNAIIGGTFNATAFTTNLTNSPTFTSNVQAGGTVTLNQPSSSLAFNGNLVNATLVVNSEYSSSGTSVATSISPRTNFNLFCGTQHVVTFSGTNTSTSQTKEFFGNIVVGTFNSSSVQTGDRCNILSTGLIGNSLVITGSSTTSNSNVARTYDGTQGSMFVGRFNAVDGTRNLTAETVFAVGTGNALSNRKTGFLIDSGSNTFVEGSLNVSGSTSLSGSFFIQSSSANLPESTGSGLLTYDQSNGQVKFSKFTNLISASLSCGEFWSTTTQSGSAGVSGSLTFNNSGSVFGVNLVSGSRLTIVNPGTFNIQFSAQIESSAGSDTQYIWFKKNGTNIADSATKVLLANNTAQVMTVNILDTAVENDYYELAFENKNGNATILYEPASGSVPTIPSVIATVTQVK